MISAPETGVCGASRPPMIDRRRRPSIDRPLGGSSAYDYDGGYMHVENSFGTTAGYDDRTVRENKR